MSLRLPHIAGWPLVVKVPVLVAGLMITVAFTIGQVVLWRFMQDQENNIRLLTTAYLDGLSAAILPAVMQGDVWEVFDALDRARSRYAGIEARYAIVELPDGRILAASDPLKFPVHAVVPDEMRKHFGPDDGLVIDGGLGRAWLARRLFADRYPVGRLLAEIDIADLLRGRREILLTLVMVNGCLTLAFALGGYFALKGMLHPFGVLARHMEQIRDGCVAPIPDDHRKRVASEFSQLFDRFNAMARALNERQVLQAQLADQEKYVMLGRLATGMAHEVNNPLGGMLNAIDTIQVHGNDPVVLQKSLDFLKRGLAGIRNVARAALVTYKGGPSSGLLTRSDLDDLRFLVQHEIGARRLRLEWQNRIAEPLLIDGAAVRQITLNLLLNACAASHLGARVAVNGWCCDGALQIAVSDEGPGLPKEMAALLYQTAPATGRMPETKGLGLWMSGHLIRRLGGHTEVKYPGVGTQITITLPIASTQARDAA